jgi:uncharacterized protein (DUF58 family)
VIPQPALWAPATTPVDAASSRRYLRPRPFTLVLVLIAILACLIWLGTRSAPQLAIGVAVIAAVVIDGVTARLALRDVTIELSTSRLLTTTDPLTCTLRVRGARRPIVLAPAARPKVQRFLVDESAPGMIVLAPRRRGVVHTLLVDATVTGPIGLVECARRLRVPLSTSVTIGPAPLPFELDWPHPRAVSFGLSEPAPVGDELYRTVRPYVRGDSRRRVHWKASAHEGTLMVKESDGTGVASVRIILQLDGPGAAAEVAVARAGWTAREALARGWWTELVTVQPRVPPVALPSPIGSPFGPPPFDLVPTLGPTQVVVHRVRTEAAVLTTLATASYGRLACPSGRGLTYLVTAGGDRWL